VSGAVWSSKGLSAVPVGGAVSCSPSPGRRSASRGVGFTPSRVGPEGRRVASPRRSAAGSADCVGLGAVATEPSAPTAPAPARNRALRGAALAVLAAAVVAGCARFDTPYSEAFTPVPEAGAADTDPSRPGSPGGPQNPGPEDDEVDPVPR